MLWRAQQTKSWSGRFRELRVSWGCSWILTYKAVDESVYCRAKQDYIRAYFLFSWFSRFFGFTAHLQPFMMG